MCFEYVIVSAWIWLLLCPGYVFLEAMPCKASLQKSCTCSCLYSSAPLAFMMSRFLIPCTAFVCFPFFSLSPVLLGGFCCTLDFLLLSSSELDLYARWWNFHEHHINLQDQASVLHSPCPGPSTGRNITKSSCCLSSHDIFLYNDCATGLCS